MSNQGDLFATEIQPLFEEYRANYLQIARDAARQLATAQGQVTIDQVRERCPPPEGVDPRVMGAVFRTSEFELVGYAKSGRATCHNRPIGIFRLADQENGIGAGY